MRIVIAALCVGALGACAPAPMPPVQAAHVLEAFAAGAADAVDVCASDGRSTLRSAVRSYAAAMAESGVSWPNLREPEDTAEPLDALEASVLISFAAGFIEASDLPQPARGRAYRMAMAHAPQVWSFRRVADEACAEVAALQRAAARYVLEMERYRDVSASARGQSGGAALTRQRALMRRAESDLAMAVAAIDARVKAR